MTRMSRERSVSDNVTIDVTPEVAYDAVSDVTQMGRWSPENTGAETSRPGRLEVGDHFLGSNVRRGFRWQTECTVIAASPGERFAFRVHRIGRGRFLVNGAIATWEYRFEGLDDGSTRVTETWTDDRGWPDRVAAIFDKAVTGGSLFADFQKKNIRRTLDRLQRELTQG